MKDDWQPGDIALCVARHSLELDNLTIGGVYTVAEVFWGYPIHPDDQESVALRLVEQSPSHPDADGYGAQYFKKIGNKKQFDAFMRQVMTPVPQIVERVDA